MEERVDIWNLAWSFPGSKPPNEAKLIEIIHKHGQDCDYKDGCRMIDHCYDRKLYNKLKEYEDAEEQGLLAKVVHGEWIIEKSDTCYWYACSECGGYIPLNQYKKEWYSDFCPTCGAKMYKPTSWKMALMKTFLGERE